MQLYHAESTIHVLCQIKFSSEFYRELQLKQYIIFPVI